MRGSGLIRTWLLAALAAGLGACGGSDGGGDNPPPVAPLPPQPPPPTPPPSPPPVIRVDFDFSAGREGWDALASDYRVGQEGRIAFEHRLAPLPSPLGTDNAYLLSSTNESDDVWMFIFRRIDGLLPHRSYRFEASLTIAANGGRQCNGIGGSPGASVTIKAGIVGLQPETRIERGDYVAVNFDKGVQTTGSAGVRVIGDFSTGSPDCTDTPYELKMLETPVDGAVASTDSAGSLWIVIGTDSGFEGRTVIYYLSGSANLTPLP